MLKYLLFFFAGALVGRRFKLKNGNRKRVQLFQTLSVLLILFIMGINLGKNQELIANLGKLGFRSAAFAVSSIFFSILFVYLYEKIIYDKRQEGD